MKIMSTVTTEDGQTFTGTAVQIVQQMRNTQWGLPVLKRDYKREVIDRVEQMTAGTNRGGPGPRGYVTAPAFIEFLLQRGVITIAHDTMESARAFGASAPATG